MHCSQNALYYFRIVAGSRILSNYSACSATYSIFCFCATAPSGSWPARLLSFLDHTQRRTTVGRTPLDEGSARRRDLYLTTHNCHKRQTSMPSVGFEPTTSASEWPQTYASDRAATHISPLQYLSKDGKDYFTGRLITQIGRYQLSVHRPVNLSCKRRPLLTSLRHGAESFLRS